MRKSAIELRTVDADTGVLIEASGSLDIRTVGRLEEAVEAGLSRGRPVAVDLSHVDFCDSTGLGMMVRLHRRAAAAGASFAVRHPQTHVADVLAMTGIDKILTVER